MVKNIVFLMFLLLLCVDGWGCAAPVDAELQLGELEQPMLGNIGTNPNPLTFWWWAGDGQQLRPALECALTRIRNATCLPIDVSIDAHHWVRQKPAELMAGRLGWTTGASWSSTRIALQTEMGANTNCRVLTHEIAQHTLRNLNDAGHVAPMFQLSADLLEDICSKHDCGCFNPETEDSPLLADEYGWACTGIGQ